MANYEKFHDDGSETGGGKGRGRERRKGEKRAELLFNRQQKLKFQVKSNEKMFPFSFPFFYIIMVILYFDNIMWFRLAADAPMTGERVENRNPSRTRTSSMNIER